MGSRSWHGPHPGLQTSTTTGTSDPEHLGREVRVVEVGRLHPRRARTEELRQDSHRDLRSVRARPHRAGSLRRGPCETGRVAPEGAEPAPDPRFRGRGAPPAGVADVKSEMVPDPPSPSARAAVRAHATLVDLLRESLRLGAIGFGGGMSVLGAIHHLAVERRRWLTEREFANTATIAQMLPGGAAANALAHVGLRLRGVAGAVVAYTGFVVPGATLTVVLAWLYVRFGVAPRAEVVLSGLNAGVVGIIAALALQMVRTAVARAWQMAVATGALLLSVAGGAASGEVALLGIAAGLVIDSSGRSAPGSPACRRKPRKRSPPRRAPGRGAAAPAARRDPRGAARGPAARPGGVPASWR